MPYAVYSKRTKIISRIINDTSSVLPSEAVIEIDEESNYPKEQLSIVSGQDIDTYQKPLFLLQDVPRPFFRRREYDGQGRPVYIKLEPRYIAPVRPDGDPVQRRLDIPINSNPFAWKAPELATVKYESLLVENYPMEVVIGEEFFDAEHIDTGSSSNYVLTEGMCVLAPGGILVTKPFSFKVTKNISGAADADEARDYIFDTYFLNIQPDNPLGIEIFWRGDQALNGADTGYQPAIPDTQMPTNKINAGATKATHLKNIQLKFVNTTGGIYSIENYLLFLRLRNTQEINVSP